MANNNICLIGKDGRIESLAQLLYDEGYDVISDIAEAVDDDILILPPNIFEIPDTNIIFKRVYCGNVTNPIEGKCFNYAVIPSFTEENAILTARGIIEIARKKGASFEQPLVTGYGYCGKAIANQLFKMGHNVDVMVRRKELKKQIKNEGYRYVDLNDNANNLKNYSCIFNTVPAMIIDSAFIDKLNSKAKIFDIASKPGGVDFQYCKEKGIDAEIYLGIPGKYYSEEAARVIYDTIASDLVLMTS